MVLAVALLGSATLVWWLGTRGRSSGRAKEHPVDFTLLSNVKTTTPISAGDHDSLEEFPLGDNVFAGIHFSVNGVIQLNGRHPDRVEGLVVGRRCRQIHLLHGTVAKMPDGTTIARMILHYRSGIQAEIPIHYGDHVVDWWVRERDPPPGPHLRIAWTGQNRLTRKEAASLHVFVNTFQNPRPGEELRSVDFVGEKTKCLPFFLGLTVE